MGQSKIQTSFVIDAATTITVTQAPAGAQNLTVAANTAYGNTDALVGDLVTQLQAVHPAQGWTGSVDVTTGLVDFTTTGAAFDWAWDADQEVRDWLGYTGDVLAQASPYTATNEHEGGYYPANLIARGIEPDGHSVALPSLAGQSITGIHDSVNLVLAGIKTRRLVIWLQRESNGDFDEFVRYWNVFDYVRDGRAFMVAPDSDEATEYTYHFAGPERVDIERRFGRGMTHFEAMWIVRDVTP